MARGTVGTAKEEAEPSIASADTIAQTGEQAQAQAADRAEQRHDDRL